MHGTKKWLMGGGAAVAAILFGAVLIPFLISSNKAITVTPPPASSNAPVETPPVTSPSTTPTQPPDHTPPALTPTTAKPQPVGDVGPVPKGSGKCDLTESEIPKTLDRAEHDLHAGLLEEAQAQYERLVGCPGAREKAQAGLRLVKKRLVNQGLSGP